MDIEKLIERLKAKDFERDYDCTPFECGVFGLLDDATTALSTLQAENEKLRAEVERVKKKNKYSAHDVALSGAALRRTDSGTVYKAPIKWRCKLELPIRLLRRR